MKGVVLLLAAGALAVSLCAPLVGARPQNPAALLSGACPQCMPSVELLMQSAMSAIQQLLDQWFSQTPPGAAAGAGRVAAPLRTGAVARPHGQKTVAHRA